MLSVVGGGSRFRITRWMVSLVAVLLLTSCSSSGSNEADREHCGQGAACASTSTTDAARAPVTDDAAPGMTTTTFRMTTDEVNAAVKRYLASHPNVVVHSQPFWNGNAATIVGGRVIDPQHR